MSASTNTRWSPKFKAGDKVYIRLRNDFAAGAVVVLFPKNQQYGVNVDGWGTVVMDEDDIVPFDGGIATLPSTITGISTPLRIEVLIHCHAGAEPHPRRSSPAVVDAIEQLEAAGAIELAHPDNIYRTTEKGRAWVAALCAVPPPVQCWKDGKTGELIEV